MLRRRARALTREVGALREELRREAKRRDEALSRAKAAEEMAGQVQRHCNELRYGNQKLTQASGDNMQALLQMLSR